MLMLRNVDEELTALALSRVLLPIDCISIIMGNFLAIITTKIIFLSILFLLATSSPMSECRRLSA